MRALSIRQPYAELILRGIKRIEYRSRPTTILGETVYLYAARQPGDLAGFRKLRCQPGDLPTGVLVGTMRIARCVEGNTHFEWHLTDVKRLRRPRKPKGHPQPVWFNPF